MVTRSTSSFGLVGTDWQQRINWERLRKYRLNRAREAMKRNGLGALLAMYDENVRYISSTVTPGWCRLKPGLRYALLCEGAEPVQCPERMQGAGIEAERVHRVIAGAADQRRDGIHRLALNEQALGSLPPEHVVVSQGVDELL